jgi:hypothetical protein
LGDFATTVAGGVAGFCAAALAHDIGFCSVVVG